MDVPRALPRGSPRLSRRSRSSCTRRRPTPPGPRSRTPWSGWPRPARLLLGHLRGLRFHPAHLARRRAVDPGEHRDRCGRAPDLHRAAMGAGASGGRAVPGGRRPQPARAARRPAGRRPRLAARARRAALRQRARHPPARARGRARGPAERRGGRDAVGALAGALPPVRRRRRRGRRHPGPAVAKQEAGADYAISQVFFEVSSYTRYLAAARAAGVTIPLLPGIVPLTDPKRLRRLQEISGVPVPPEILQRLDAATDLAERRAVGTAMGVDLVHQVLAAGAPGLHIYTFNQHTPALDLLEGAHLDDRGHLGPDAAGGPQVTAPLFTKG